MSSNGHVIEWYAGTLRALHLAILRYAVTRDNADRLAVFRIAREIDSLEPGQDGRRISTSSAGPAWSSAPQSCSRTQARQQSCNNTWCGLNMTVSNGLSRRRSTPASQPCRLPAGPSDAGMTCGRALPAAETVDDANCCGAGSGSHGGLTRRRPMHGRESASPAISVRDRAYSVPLDGIA
jgi:hypothetical protein